jgi:hypothetical protein
MATNGMVINKLDMIPDKIVLLDMLGYVKQSKVG